VIPTVAKLLEDERREAGKRVKAALEIAYDACEEEARLRAALAKITTERDELARQVMDMQTTDAYSAGHEMGTISGYRMGWTDHRDGREPRVPL
jgi:hypothetical protein